MGSNYTLVCDFVWPGSKFESEERYTNQDIFLRTLWGGKIKTYRY